MAGRGFEIELRPVLHHDLAGGAVDHEPSVRIVGQAVGEGLAHIGIDRRDRADDRAVDRVLVHGSAGQRQVGRRLVDDIGQVDRHDLVVCVAAGIGDPHRDVVIRVAFEIELRSVGNGDDAGVRVDGEASAGIVDQAVGKAFAGIRVDARDRSDHRPVGRVLGDAVRGQRGVCRPFVDVGQVDRHDLVVCVAAGIGDPHRDVVIRVAFEIELRSVGNGDDAGVRVDGEASAGIVDQAVGKAFAGIRVDARDRSDHRPVGRVLGDAVRGQRGVCRPFVDVADIQRPGVDRRIARAVGHAHRDVVRRGVFEIEQRTVGNGDDAGIRVDGEATACIIDEAVGQRVAVGVGGAGRADHGACRGVLREGERVIGKAHRSGVRDGVMIDLRRRRKIVRNIRRRCLAFGSGGRGSGGRQRVLMVRRVSERVVAASIAGIALAGIIRSGRVLRRNGGGVARRRIARPSGTGTAGILALRIGDGLIGDLRHFGLRQELDCLAAHYGFGVDSARHDDVAGLDLDHLNRHIGEDF